MAIDAPWLYCVGSVSELRKWQAERMTSSWIVWVNRQLLRCLRHSSTPGWHTPLTARVFLSGFVWLGYKTQYYEHESCYIASLNCRSKHWLWTIRSWLTAAIVLTELKSKSPTTNVLLTTVTILYLTCMLYVPSFLRCRPWIPYGVCMRKRAVWCDIIQRSNCKQIP